VRTHMQLTPAQRPHPRVAGQARHGHRRIAQHRMQLPRVHESLIHIPDPRAADRVEEAHRHSGAKLRRWRRMAISGPTTKAFDAAELDEQGRGQTPARPVRAKRRAAPAPTRRQTRCGRPSALSALKRPAPERAMAKLAPASSNSSSMPPSPTK
jgi:hypothetical protein